MCPVRRGPRCLSLLLPHIMTKHAGVQLWTWEACQTQNATWHPPLPCSWTCHNHPFARKPSLVPLWPTHLGANHHACNIIVPRTGREEGQLSGRVVAALRQKPLAPACRGEEGSSLHTTPCAWEAMGGLTA